MEAYPNQKFILLGDDSQEDPNIYTAVVKYFPQNVHAVYIRHIVKAHETRVKNTLENIEKTGIPCYYFVNSAEAIIHSKKIGLIPE